MLLDNTTQAFLELVKTGLWADLGSTDLRNHSFASPVDWKVVYRLAEEQSIVGLVLAGIEQLRNANLNVNVNHELLLQWIGETQMLETQNRAMNKFLVNLIKKLRKEDVYAILVKGQGVAQCYEKPLWRTSGDIDLLLDEKNYKKAEKLLVPLADEDQGENAVTKHHAVIVNGFDIELHGKMPFLLSKRVDRMIDEVIADTLKMGGIRVWRVDDTDIYLPNPDNDVIIVWTHMLHHFFIEGVGLRQVCDWCRLLWTYRDSLNYELLESRIHNMGLMTEWKAFGALAVEYLGMPAEAMPLFNANARSTSGRLPLGDDRRRLPKQEGKNVNLSWWDRWRAKRVLARIIKSGNFGHNKDLSYRAKYTGFTYRLVALWRRLVDFIGLSQLFPLDAPRFFVTYVFGKV